MPNFHQVQIGLEPDTIEELDDLADRDDTPWSSRSEIVREFVDDGLDAQKGTAEV